MRSNYKKLAPYIREVDIRNTEDKKDNLLGVSTQKVFIKSIANTVGTDFKSYKIVKKGQFTYVPDTSRRGDKIGIALLEDEDQGLVSQAYTVFEVIDTEKLLPEYLMMWFRRPEFDRYARYMSYGSVREIFSWEEMGNVELPIPDITKQREIVKEYNVLVNRIALNNKLIQKLEETAQAIYKQWFVDFEFPDENGKPYKSNGGEMLESELGEIPKGWKVGRLEDLNLDVSDGNYSAKYPKSSEFQKEGVPFVRGTDFEQKCINPFNLQYITKEKHSQLLKGHIKEGDILITTRGSIGKYAYVTSKFIGANINSQLVRLNGQKTYSTFFLGCLLDSQSYQESILSATTGSVQPQLPISNLMKTKLIIPNEILIKTFSDEYSCLLVESLRKSEENYVLRELLNILLCRISTVF